MEILKFPNPLLFEVTSEITYFGEELKVILDGMWDTMKASNGLGLAANQVGMSLRMFVMVGPNGEKLYIVNPSIVAKSFIKAKVREGCLSAPGDFVIVPSRNEWVHIQFQNEKGEDMLITLKGLHSVCAQHEIDHLNGKSFMENKSIPKRDRQALIKKWGIK